MTTTDTTAKIFYASMSDQTAQIAMRRGGQHRPPSNLRRSIANMARFTLFAFAMLAALALLAVGIAGTPEIDPLRVVAISASSGMFVLAVLGMLTKW